MKAPSELIIYAGRLRRTDGSTAAPYLKEWMERLGIRNGRAVCIISRDDLQKLFDEIEFLKSLQGIA